MSNILANSTVATDMDMFVSSDKIYLHSVLAPAEVLAIDRVTHAISIIPYEASVIPSTSERRLIFGIVGIINLIAGPYLIVITNVTRVGTIFNQTILRIDATDIIPFTKTTLHLTDDQVTFNNSYLSMAKSVLATEYFYYSPTYDLSHTMQRLANFPPDFRLTPMIDRSDNRFVWNRFLLQDLSLRGNDFKKYCLPIIHGFVSIKTITVNGVTFNWTVVSRRNIHRAGVRLLIRGVDSRGNPANYVETEQIVEYTKSPSGQSGRFSHVQVRGSIPLYWSQMPNLKYKPPPVTVYGVNQVDVCAKHLDHLTSTYGLTILVNLINQTGSEGKMEKELAYTLSRIQNPNVKYVAFDFHHECRNMRWDRLSLLMERIYKDIDDFGYFHSRADGGSTEGILQEQRGLFRTNCIDSLDRTNVVQGLIARRVLENQLRSVGILTSGESVNSHGHFEVIYRNVWADNADVISLEYSGTGALKTDFTRTGKRTKSGVLMDGVNSMTRYFKNNFSDGFRQDAIDLFLGNYVPNREEGKSLKCPLDQSKEWKYLSLPLFLLASMAMFTITFFIHPEYSAESVIYLFFWLSMMAMTFFVIIVFGSEFVDFPKLSDLRSPKLDK